MMTYLGLRTVDPDHFMSTGVGFRLLAGRLSTRADDLTDTRGRLDQAWTGAAANGAARCCDRLGERLRDASTAALRCDQVLYELGLLVRRAHVLLDEADDLARLAGVSIGAGGRAALPMTGASPDPGTVQACAEVNRRVDAAVGLADRADQAAADDLRELTRRLADPIPPAQAVDPVALPPAGATPASVAAWWAGLAEPQREWLIADRPDLVGPLDGVPAVDRDAANRLRLAVERERLTGLRRDTVAAGGEPLDPVRTARLAWIDGQLRGADAIEARLADGVLPRAYLLDVSTDADGRAVIAVGNPDHATDVLTYVPGMGSGLPGVGLLVNRADAMADATAGLGPQHQVAVVAWLGYDPPDGGGAVLADAAQRAEGSLGSFTDGLRASHEGPPSHNTVLGHSYGSLVAGVTARDRGLDTDELVFVGSPGVGVDEADDLRMDDGHVWASTAANDPVQRYAPGLGQLAMDTINDALRPFSATYGDAKPDVFLWHGLNPDAGLFGARVFASDPDGGHNGYWQGLGLDNIARIAVGADVR